MKTIVYLAHSDVASSTSHQFLISSGKEIAMCDYVDLTTEFQQNNQSFNIAKERERLLQYDRIIFQFQLYWYQAPAIMKRWLDAVLDQDATSSVFYKQLAGRELGIVLIAGVKAEHYQAGAREQVTVSDLLSPYQALARHFGMKYLAPFAIHQFNYMDEAMKLELMMRYGCFLETGAAHSFTALQAYIIKQLKALTPDQLELSDTQDMLFDMFVDEVEERAGELGDLVNLMDTWS